MLTTEEIAAVPLFATLAPDALKALAGGAGDIRLNPGEYVIHEGDEPALLVVISGKLEVTKLIDGIERKIGERLPGKMAGEIPIVYGTQYQSSARAAEPTRVMRLEPRQYYAVAAASPEFVATMGAIARERIGGLQGIVAEGRKVMATLLGQRWDNDCLALRRFLASNQITFDWLTLDSPDLATRWPAPLPTPAELPAVRLADGTVRSHPELRDLATRLGLQTTANRTDYDTIIIGGGPAGLAAAVYGASEGLRTVVIERDAPGGQAGTSSRIENYLGFPSGISGDELASRALRQARRLGAEVLITRRIHKLDPMARTLTLDGGETLSARTIILATGVSWRRVGIEGFDRLIGKGIYYGAARSEANTTQGLDIHLIGAGNSAGQAAIFFSSHARTVTLVVRGDALEKSMSQYLVEQIRAKSNIRVALQTEVATTHGDDHLVAIDLKDRANGEIRREDSAGLFVFIGADAETDWLPPEIVRDARGYVLTGADAAASGHWTGTRDPFLLETSVPGVFACGDVRFSPVKRVASAVGEGSMAIAFVHQYLAQLNTPAARRG